MHSWSIVALECGNMVYLSGNLAFDDANYIAVPNAYTSSKEAVGAALDLDTGYPAVCWFDGANIGFMEKDGGYIRNCSFSLLFTKGT